MISVYERFILWVVVVLSIVRIGLACVLLGYKAPGSFLVEPSTNWTGKCRGGAAYWAGCLSRADSGRVAEHCIFAAWNFILPGYSE